MEMQWENLGGFLVSHSKLEHLLTRIEDGSIQSWDELHGVYRELSSAYEQDARTFAWGILGYLSLDPESAAAAGNLHGAQSAQPWHTPSKDALVAQFKQARDVAAEIAQRVYATRAKDWSNPFRKSTFRNETEQAAVYGRIEDNGAIQAVRREMEATQQAIDRLLSRLGAEKAQ